MISTTHKRTLVTSALPYANGYAHLGHLAGAYLPADIFTRFLRSVGEEVIHVSGSDEHGVAIEISADAEGVPPSEIINKYHAANEAAFRGVGIDFDIFGRTSWPEHHKNAQDFFLVLYNQGLLVEKEEDQFYDATAGKFLPDRFVEGTCPNCGHVGARGDQCDNCSATYNQTALINPVSVISGKTPELRTTKHFYLKLGEFQTFLEEYTESHSQNANRDLPAESIWREHVLQQTRSWLKQGLGDRAITRDLNWGVDVPLPGYEGKKIYVWFDAPIGYITNTQVLEARRGNPEEWKKWWCDEGSQYFAFIGKDNIVFHTLIFPSMLSGYNRDGRIRYNLPENVPACEFLNLEGRKFSKSKHWGIDVREYLEEFPPDPLRYTLATNLPENKDSDFTWREYQARTNNELADILGNFVNRTMQFVSRYFDGTVPALVADSLKEGEVKALLQEDLRRLALSGADESFEELVPKYLKYFNRNDLTMLLTLASAPQRIAALYRSFRFREAALETMNVARAANKYFNDSEPWKTRTADPARCAVSLNICVQTIRSLAILFEPIIPFTSEKLFQMLGVERRGNGEWNSAAQLGITTGHTFGAPAILFEKVEDSVIEHQVAKLGADANAGEPEIEVELKPEITIDDVMRLDLRVATVLEAERVKKSDKLLRLQIKIGNLRRQILAGVGKTYEPEELVGKRIVVVANLKPAKLMGQESQGMLFAANSPEGVPILIGIMNEDESVSDGFIVR